MVSDNLFIRCFIRLTTEWCQQHDAPPRPAPPRLVTPHCLSDVTSNSFNSHQPTVHLKEADFS